MPNPSISTLLLLLYGFALFYSKVTNLYYFRSYNRQSISWEISHKHLQLISIALIRVHDSDPFSSTDFIVALSRPTFGLVIFLACHILLNCMCVLFATLYVLILLLLVDYPNTS